MPAQSLTPVPCNDIGLRSGKVVEPLIIKDVPSSMHEERMKPQYLSNKMTPIIVGLQGRPGFYTINLAPTKRPTVLALSATTYEQVAVSPETVMGCHRIRFLQAKEGYYCTFSLNKYNYTIQSFDIHLNSFAVQIKTVTCLTLNWEFTVKLLTSSDLYLSDIYRY